MMGKQFGFDYYYGIEAEQFSFYRVPRLLIKDKRFENLSSDAKLLYGLLLDRMSLSMKNGWLDAENKVYIYYKIEEIMNDLSCARGTATKIMAELDSKKGIGLIEKKRQGLGRPDIIYVKNFATVMQEKSEKSEEDLPNNHDGTSEKVDSDVPKASSYGNNNSYHTDMENLLSIEEKKKPEGNVKDCMELAFPEVQNLDFRKYKDYTSESSEVELVECQELDPNYTNTNYTNNSYNDISYNNPIYPIHLSDKREDRCDGLDNFSDYVSLIKKNLEYDLFMQDKTWNDRELYDELFEIVCDVVCVKRKSIRVSGENYPYELVKSKFLKLNSSHLTYVIDCMRKTVSKIGNIKAYMITALYNAGSTISHYYQQAVQHDMYGGGWQEAGIV